MTSERASGALSIESMRGIMLPALLGLAAGAAVAAVAPAQPSGDMPPAVAAQAPARAAGSPNSGMDAAVAVKVTPVRTRADASGRERMDYSVDIAPSHRVQTTAAYSYEIVKVKGTRVASYTSANVVIAEGASGYQASITTPTNLADGHYLLRVGAAVTNSKAGGSAQQEAYFRLQGGKIAPLSYVQWVAQSGVNQARVIVSSFQPQNEEEARTRFAAVQAPAPAP